MKSRSEGGGQGEYQSAYEHPLSGLAGSYSLGTGDAITVAADGSFSMQETSTGCTFNGQVSIINPFYAVYRLNVTATNCTTLTSWNGVAEQGLITFNTGQANVTNTVFGGTSFNDSNGVPYIKVFQ